MSTDPTEEYLQAAARLEDAGLITWDQQRGNFVKTTTRRGYEGPRDPISEADLLNRLGKVHKSQRGWSARCPAHADRMPSLSVRRGDRAWLLKCHAGCTFHEIAAALGVRPQDLWFADD